MTEPSGELVQTASSNDDYSWPGFSFLSGAGQFLVKDLGVRRLSFLHVKMLGLDG